MKERPILFSAPMVRALLAGTKTQTRRVVKPQPELTENRGFVWKGNAYGSGSDLAGTVRNFAKWNCPYGQPCDRLFVRETWDFRPWATVHDKRSVVVAYRAGGQSVEIEVPATWNPTLYNYWRWRPSIHMPRWASRITLEVTGVRVERLQDISEADAVDEGMTRHLRSELGYSAEVSEETFNFTQAKSTYRLLWNKINGLGSWDANPWVWVVEFKRVGGVS